MRSSYWSSDGCSSDLSAARDLQCAGAPCDGDPPAGNHGSVSGYPARRNCHPLFGGLAWRRTRNCRRKCRLRCHSQRQSGVVPEVQPDLALAGAVRDLVLRSEEHTSELKSLMRISYAVFCLKKKNATLS